MEFIILIIYLTIILLNIYAQFNEKFTRGKIYNLSYVVFIFKLFAPNPLITDMRIFYRDKLKNGEETSLKEYIFFDKSKFKNTLWKFSNYKHLIIYKHVLKLQKDHLKEVPDEKILKSYAYKIIERDVKITNYNSNIKTRQIVIYFMPTNKTEPHPFLISHIKYNA